MKCATFLAIYKNLENKETAVNEVSGKEAAIQIIEKSIQSYKEKYCNN